MPEDCVGEVECRAQGTEIKGNKHVPHVIHSGKGFQISRIGAGYWCAVFEAEPRKTGVSFDWNNTWEMLLIIQLWVFQQGPPLLWGYIQK